MSGYPKARWSVGEGAVGASVWTREVPEGEGGGYYLYTWRRDSRSITLSELAEGTTPEARLNGASSAYVTLEVLEVPRDLLGQGEVHEEIGVARLIHADLRQRFGGIAEWIPYGADGKPVWFHAAVTGGN